MISYLEGVVVFQNEKYILVLVNGVGYKVFLSSATSDRIQRVGDAVKVFTHLHVREDALDLYGFLDATELELFEMLLTVSGIGPKMALTIISIDRPSVLAGAISREDAGFLTKISGIGTKMAHKMILELKEKISRLSFKAEDAEVALDGDAIDALVGLGWNVREARTALRAISKDIVKTELRIKEALKTLGK
ncbi:Holliday junction DNA helicase RuvA [Candidatus Azambacteria bacterium RIFCSPHIGHO2_02_FULL_52_12]|uniref:Holliday junction branch migration complex subunit RuvA n=1 Tax=Candidatus Azambacteria bacterium RIFCSPLOWO2_01_FULL_46_25 TaxID=1797298 RepID=A0A1F5BV00_9BACT|nr:MAG: Holliday junction DNA helicase RuvA [Candidatus Azambacteria bacterium RIFCSPHIGHO2_02_FULL_52_12]OGD34444.1 MAG: Holliday junction DNA helicase RuvA [Candidatus Azambacteria bacterium RIFCSPLOWO2_01_FULL_46_25]OGD37278.1 MAG: Holliday junction DNA helicase RuvA [Candidatus Azambacteria bacterium RIFCSPHIGHO2_01_FULL_51_74]